jgi:hypothetical protein
VELKTLGLDLEGIHDPKLSEKVGSAHDLFQPPKCRRQFVDTRDNGYGNGPPFVVLPLALFALIVLTAGCTASLFHRGGPLPGATWRMLAIAAPCLAVLAITPSLYWARYNVYAMVAAMALVLWLLGEDKWRDLSQAVIGALLITGLMTLHWSDPGWCVSAKKAFELAGQSPLDRAVTSLPLCNHLAGELGRLREAEIKAGDVVAYTSCEFPAAMWNEAVSNKVVYTPWTGDAEHFLKKLDKVNAKWIFVRPQSQEYEILSKADNGWEPIAAKKISAHFNPAVFRRRAPSKTE